MSYARGACVATSNRSVCKSWQRTTSTTLAEMTCSTVRWVAMALKLIKCDNYSPELPSYRTEDWEVVIQRYGSLPSMRRWVVTVGSYQLPRSERTRGLAVAAAE